MKTGNCGVQKQKARERARTKLIEYLANPANKPLRRIDYAIKILGYRHNTRLYSVFTPFEVSQIEREALELRRQQYAVELAKVDKGILKAAAEGDAHAAKLCYQRFEGWEPSEKRRIDLNGELRVAAFKELLKALNEENPGFSDILPGGGSGTGDVGSGTTTGGQQQ